MNASHDVLSHCPHRASELRWDSLSEPLPELFSADARLSKDFKVNPKYTIRISVAGFNLTDHFNPEAIHTNIDDPAYGAFVGQHGRRYTADFDVLF